MPLQCWNNNSQIPVTYLHFFPLNLFLKFVSCLCEPRTALFVKQIELLMNKIVAMCQYIIE